MGFDYEIIYKKGKDNTVADALSRVRGAELLCFAISVISSDLEEKIKSSYALDPHLQGIVQKLVGGDQVQHYILQNDLLRRKHKLVVGPDTEVRTSIIAWHHMSMEAGHVGREATIMRVKRLFFWKHMVRGGANILEALLIFSIFFKMGPFDISKDKKISTLKKIIQDNIL